MKYRRAAIDAEVDKVFKKTCPEIEKRYEVKSLEIRTDKNDVHFLIRSVLSYSVTKMVTLIKSVSAREIFKKCPDVKKLLWGGECWLFFVGKHGYEAIIESQGGEFHEFHKDHQLALLYLRRACLFD